MKVFVKTLTGTHFQIKVKPEDTGQSNSLTTKASPSGSSSTSGVATHQGFPSMRSNARAGNLDFLRNSQQYQQLRAMVQANPQLLQPILREMGKQNPQLLRLIQGHRAETVTAEERAAIERLEGMGFGRAIVLEVYFSCNKNEEVAANYLLDHVQQFMDD